MDHRGIRRVLDFHHLSPDVLRQHDDTLPHAPLPPVLAGPPLSLPLEPPTLAQR
jgi:hypothetical protein